MSTLNGFGTLFYGWRHLPGQASTATKWLSAFYVPLIPVGRYQLKVLTDFSSERTQVRTTPVGLLASQRNHFEILERTPLSWREVLLTYVNTFVGLPFLMFAPSLIAWLLGWLLSWFGWMPHYKTQADAPMWLSLVTIAIVIGLLANILYWPIWAIRKSRGLKFKG
jgi:hypothetical protein